MFKLAIVGSRAFVDLDLVRRYVRSLDPAKVIIYSGGARGVDRAAATEGRRLGFEVVELLADWDGEGRSAGFNRNERLVDLVDGLVAFWDGKSRGTAHSVELARRRGIWVRVCTR